MYQRKSVLGLSSGLWAKAIKRGAAGLLVSGALMLGAPVSALADDCAALGGVLSVNQCTVSGDVTFGTDRILFLDNDLLITGTGSITTNGNDLIINANGNIILDAGAIISADNRGGCPAANGGNITLNADTDSNFIGDVITAPGSQITANSSCSAGAIVITGSTITIGGEVESISTISGTGRPGGGPITIDATCDLSVPGIVTSKGEDAGADRVHLEAGCVVTISGLVQSISTSGHGPPSNPRNHCYDPDLAGDEAGNPDPLGASDDDRLDKPSNSAGCIEVWAGENPTGDDSLVITGEINADLDRSGTGGTSWIDLFARENIKITGGVGNAFAVHANGKGATNDDGGRITVLSTEGDVLATGSALQANATKPGGKGGKLTVHAFNNVNLNGARLSAQGDSTPAGGLGVGGIIDVRAFHNALSWTNGDGNVLPNQTGTITLTRCVSLDIGGTVFNGEVPGLVVQCVGDPVLPKNPADSVSYVVLPPCECEQLIAPCICAEGAQRVGNLLTIFAPTTCAEGRFLGELAVVGDETTLVGFSATCEANPTCRATVNPATRTNVQIDVTIPSCAVPGNFIILGIDGSFPNPQYQSFSCLKARLQ